PDEFCLQGLYLHIRAPTSRSFRVAPVQKPHRWTGSHRAQCSSAALEYSQASSGELWSAWFPQEWFRFFCPWMRRTVERNIPRAPEYRLAFRVEVADKSERHSGGSTDPRGSRRPEPIA